MENFTAKAAYPFKIQRLSPAMKIDVDGNVCILDTQDLVVQAGDLVTLDKGGNFTVIRKPLTPEPPIEERQCRNCGNKENLKPGELVDVLAIIGGDQIVNTGQKQWIYKCGDHQ